MYIKGNGIQLLLPRLDALLLSMVLCDRSRNSNLVLTWTPLITCSNPSGCSPHALRYSFLRLLFSFNIIPVYRGTSRLSHGSPHKLLIYLVQKGETFLFESDQSDQHQAAHTLKNHIPSLACIHLHVHCKQCTHTVTHTHT